MWFSELRHIKGAESIIFKAQTTAVWAQDNEDEGKMEHCFSSSEAILNLAECTQHYNLSEHLPFLRCF